MMLYTVRIEPNKVFLRALMTNFFASSSVAHVYLARVEAFKTSPAECAESYFNKIWSKAADVGPLPQKEISEFLRQAECAKSKCYNSYLKPAWEKLAKDGPVQDVRLKALAAADHKRDLDDAKGLFFAHLIDFVRNIKFPTSKFAALPDTVETRMLKDALKDNLGKIVQDLQSNAVIRDIILSDFTPAQMEKPPMQPAPPPVMITEEDMSIVPLMREGLEVGIPLTPPESQVLGLRLH
jgi:hypothetical protein